MPERNINKKEKNSIGKPFIAVIATLIILIVAIVLINLKERQNYFVTLDNNLVTFNRTALEDFYPFLSSLPYSVTDTFATEKKGYRVIIMGSASTAGWPYAEKYSAGSIIRRKLGKHNTGTEFEIINIAFSGFNSSHALDIIPALSTCSPDLVIIYTGKNEFYSSSFFPVDRDKENASIWETLGAVIGAGETKLKYDNKKDDLELIRTLHSEIPLVKPGISEYESIKEKYVSNIRDIIDICENKGTELAFFLAPDNYMLPPLGIDEESNNIDLLYNEARMALLRDGRPAKARQLFSECIDKDALRLRTPAEFRSLVIKECQERSIVCVDLDEIFAAASETGIPGSDLFDDYIHPNKKGLDLIATEYARITAALAGISPEIESFDTKTDNFSFNSFSDSGPALKRISVSFNTLYNHALGKNLRIYGYSPDDEIPYTRKEKYEYLQTIESPPEL